MMEQYIAKTIHCSCGKTHQSKVEKIVIKHQVIENELMEYLIENGYKRITVVCDKAGYKIVGNAVCKALDCNHIQYRLHRFQNDTVVPDEYSVGNLAMGLDPDCDILLAVGSGTVNDLCRFVSALVHKPFCTVGTAPSMDGYISSGSALIYNNWKLTFETHAPKAVFFDPVILSEAPMDMIASGVGDLLGKISCLTDWRLSHIINDEWHCDFIWGIVDDAVKKTAACYQDITKRSPQAITMLTEALLLSGVAMDFAGNSRPASGCEHHMSHFLEMRYLLEKRSAVFHGTKVGINTIIALKAYQYLLGLTPDFHQIKTAGRLCFSEWEQQIKLAFLDASEEIVNLEKQSGKNNVEKLRDRLVLIEEKWDQIRSLAENVIRPESVTHILKEFHAPAAPQEIGVTKEMAKQMILYSKEIRNRYTVLQLLWDLNELEHFADFVIEEYFPHCGKESI